MGARSHTYSNSSTFRGWLESMGLDDLIFNPCDCIFGNIEPEPVPIPGKDCWRRMSLPPKFCFCDDVL